jgi:RimJ/RimL family protein N-acetyltransferase
VVTTLVEKSDSNYLEIMLEPWSEDDHQLLVRCNAPELMRFLGGPETDEQVVKRHQRYLDGWKNGSASMFRISVLGLSDGVGVIGYWDISWKGEEVYEAGWTVFAEWQGQGIASQATRLMLEHARSRRGRLLVHAFPTVVHLASNGVCRKAGFTLIGPCDFLGFNGSTVLCNDWAYELNEK